jgi:hypothetical protein
LVCVQIEFVFFLMSPQAVQTATFLLLTQWRQSINDATSFRETPLFYLKQQICLMAKLINAYVSQLYEVVMTNLYAARIWCGLILI